MDKENCALKLVDEIILYIWLLCFIYVLNSVMLVQNTWYQMSYIIFNTAPILIFLGYIQYRSYCLFFMIC